MTHPESHKIEKKGGGDESAKEDQEQNVIDKAELDTPAPLYRWQKALRARSADQKTHDPEESRKV